MQRYRLISLSGKEKTIVDIPGPAPEKGPANDRGGAVYGYYVGG